MTQPTSAAADLNAIWAERLGWAPSWFGQATFDARLVAAVSAFQADHGLSADGVCGPATYRRALLDRQARGDAPVDATPAPAGSDRMIVAGEPCPVAWPRVVTAGEPGALTLLGGFAPARAGRPLRRVDAAIVHWDVAINARSCYQTLCAGNISSHFVIDWDGTIYQMLDVAHVAWHSGIGTVNDRSVGIDLNTPVYPRYAAAVAKAGQPPRPVASELSCNGWKPGPILGAHQVQLDALAALLAALAAHPEIKLRLAAPAWASPTELTHLPSERHFGRGVYHHAEVDWPRRYKGRDNARAGKWDTLGVDLRAVCAAAVAIGGGR